MGIDAPSAIRALIRKITFLRIKGMLWKRLVRNITLSAVSFISFHFISNKIDFIFILFPIFVGLFPDEITW